MRIAILGMGSIGRRHLANLLALGERDILIHDNHSGQMADASGTFDVPLARCMAELWAWHPDAVLICTPPDSHLALVEEAVDHKVKDIFIEKPLALSLGEWQKLACVRWLGKPIDRAAVTMVACNMRFAAGPLAIKKWLDEEAIGEVLSARFFCGYHLPGVRPDYATSYVATTGAILDIASHEVDIATWLLGPANLKGAIVRSAASIGLPDMDGMAEMLLQHESGVVSSIHVDFLSPYYLRTIRVQGIAGSASWGWNGQVSTAHLHSRADVIIESHEQQDDGAAMYRAELAHFLACVRDGQQTCNPIGAATKVLNILLQAKAV